jgi:endonuclease/exonuclease/phosphatase family metal-dependent hydrolase
MDAVLFGSFARPGWNLWPPDRIRVVSWNIDRGLRLPEIMAFVRAQDADILVLQEVDLNARRTGYRNIAEEIAIGARMNYAFGREFQELTQGRRSAPAYHGQATLSRWPITNSRVIRFRRQSNFWRPRWFLPRVEPIQERLGGRIALLSEIEICGQRLLVYNIHLESRGSDALRAAQLSETLDDAAKYLADRPVLVAGDLNVDVARSPLAAELRLIGFHSAIQQPAPHTTTPRGLFRQPRTIDWAYLAGRVQPMSWRVYDGVKASDHYPLFFELRFLPK